MSLVLTSCGGGSSSAGAGGSGIGGTGITTVTGNISQVIARAPEDQTPGRSLLAMLARFISAPVNAQSFMLGDIEVFGGGRITTTDAGGNFALQGVTPSRNFIINFTPPGEQTIALPIGEVPEGSRVRVNDVVLDTNRGFASAGDITINASEFPFGDSESGGGQNDDEAPPSRRDGDGPDNGGPDNGGPDNGGPDNEGPDDGGPDDGGPDDGGPDDEGPDDEGPDDQEPDKKGPKDKKDPKDNKGDDDDD